MQRNLLPVCAHHDATGQMPIPHKYCSSPLQPQRNQHTPLCRDLLGTLDREGIPLAICVEWPLHGVQQDHLPDANRDNVSAESGPPVRSWLLLIWSSHTLVSEPLPAVSVWGTGLRTCFRRGTEGLWADEDCCLRHHASQPEAMESGNEAELCSVDLDLALKGAGMPAAETGKPYDKLHAVAKWTGLCACAIVGALTREGLSTLHAETLYPAFDSLSAILLGCFVMGMVRQQKAYLSGRVPLLTTALSTGFCGCCTTFSSWMEEAVAVPFRPPPKFGSTVLDGYTPAQKGVGWLAVLLYGLAGASGALAGGQTLASLLSLPAPQNALVCDRTAQRQRVLYAAVASSVIAACIAAPFAMGHSAGWTAVFAPLGMAARYHLAKWNNAAELRYFGTMAANVLGTISLGLFFILDQRVVVDGSTA